jgi:hypothetical protein
MILGAHREPDGVRVGGQALGHGPGREHTVAFQADVPVQPPGVVLLDDEAVARTGLRIAGRHRLRGAPYVAFAAVLVQRHSVRLGLSPAIGLPLAPVASALQA